MELFLQLNGEGITVVMVTHDVKTAQVAHRIVCLQDGLIVSDGSSVFPGMTGE